METKSTEEKLIKLTKKELTMIEFKAFKEGVNAGDNAVRAAVRLAQRVISKNSLRKTASKSAKVA